MQYFSYCHVAGRRKLFRICKKQTVIFIIVKDMIRFFGSNIKCFEYLSHAHQMFQGVSHVHENYSIINGLVFIKSSEQDYKYFFINFLVYKFFIFLRDLMILTRKNYVLLNLVTRMAARLVLTFSIRLHDQLNSIHSIITY